ncbi:Plasmodium variant antigen protein Cir/Yir/Bir, putative [Plasmodium chabaudi chabaudi]|uniref:Plasmodium variant antigen protein Cir/Yir/Bir, putative n=1 Tax=Plasmodium chabaudi chabaudi TaxID=31271 RepID=A0A1D3L7B1_PLACU|nr:Plasmodium variant antigen protein Cir/Yir/Bir, putative [Plasmodium chabaudi chabaudi]
MSEELCDQINFANENVDFDSASQKYTCKDKIFETYCSSSIKGEKGQCESDEELLGSAFMALLKNFESVDGENPKDDKLYQYAVLWLSYKIKQNPNIEFIRSTIDDILKKNDWYNELNISVDDKKNAIRFHYIYLTNLYNFLKGICNTINKCKDSSNNDECIKSAEECGKLYRSCLIAFPWAEICNPYCNVLTNLKNDYDEIRKKYSLPELNLPQGLSDCNGECVKQNIRYKDWRAKQNRSSGGSKIDTPPEVSLPGPSVPPTSINNGNKLPYIAVPLILIPIILGISYKYLTPVWRKKAKRKAVKKIINLSDQKKA